MDKAAKILNNQVKGKRKKKILNKILANRIDKQINILYKL